MNKIKEQQLKKIANNISLLYIESNKNLQIQISSYLSSVFTKFYQSFNSVDGLKKFNQFKPDIVLMDLEFSSKNAIELLADIKQLNKNANIIVLSNKNDDFELLQNIDMGILAFLVKPLDVDKLFDTLIKVVNERLKEEETIFDKLKDFESEDVFFINSYKGLPIINQGRIHSMNHNDMVAELSPIQVIATRYEKQVIVKLSSKNKYLKVNYLKHNKNSVTFINPKYLDYKTRDEEYKRIKPDNSFQVTFGVVNKKMDIKILDFSFKALCGVVQNEKFDFKIGDDVEIALAFRLETKNAYMQDSKLVKAFGKGKILRIEEFKSGYKVAINIDIRKADQTIYKKYLNQREMDIIQEFKQLIRRNQS
jgi:YesN/AraC family two-component response regulator